MKTENPNLLSPSVLAFVGDAVYGLYVRTALAAVNRPSGELHKLSVTMVNAAAQAKAYSFIEPELSEKEISVFKRGRNFHTSSTPLAHHGARFITLLPQTSASRLKSAAPPGPST